MVTLSFIRRHLSTLAEGEIVTTRDLLYAGPRREVDYAVSKCIRDGWIERVARGVFVRTITTFIIPTVEKVAEVKAKSFGRDLRINGYTTAVKEGLIFGPQLDTSFYVDGSSSSFVYMGETRVHFRKASKKIMRLVDEGPGLAVRAIMAVGRKIFTAWHIDKLKPLWSNPAARALLFNSRQWMHAWLGDWFQSQGYCGPGNFNSSADTVDEPDYLSYKEWTERRLQKSLLDCEGDSEDLSFWSSEGDDLDADLAAPSVEDSVEDAVEHSAEDDNKQVSSNFNSQSIDFNPPLEDISKDSAEGFEMRSLGWSLEDVFDDINFSDSLLEDDSG